MLCPSVEKHIVLAYSCLNMEQTVGEHRLVNSRPSFVIYLDGTATIGLTVSQSSDAVELCG